MQASLCAFLDHFNDLFKCGNKNNSVTAEQIVKGLFLSYRGERNLERITEQTSDRSFDKDYQRLQHFITHSPWDGFKLMNRVAIHASNLFDNEEDTAYIIDEKSHLKKGKQSVGVCNQYAGTVGKTENCQVGVYSALVNGQISLPINTRLFLSKKWVDDEERCKKAQIPQQARNYKTKHQLAIDMIREDLENGVRFGWIGGDGLYGHSYELSDQIDELKQKFVFDVHQDQFIYLSKPEVRIPKNKRTGRPHTRLVSDIEPMEARAYMASLKDQDFQKITIRKTPKGPLKYRIHVVKVWTWLAPSSRDKGQKQPRERTLIIRKSISSSNRPKVKYSLSNFTLEEVSIERFAYMQAQRFWIEKSFKDNSQDIGMSDYQVRKYHAWYHFQAMTMLAMLFVTYLKINNKEELPLLSYRDVKQLIYTLFIDNQASRMIRMLEQLVLRHHRRQRDIDRYYQRTSDHLI